MKLVTALLLASTFALSGTSAYAHTIPRGSDVRTYTAYRNAAPRVVLQPDYGNSNGSGYGNRDVWGSSGSYYGPIIPSGAGGR